MRDFSFASTDRPTLSEFNKRFKNIADFADGIGNEHIWGIPTSKVVVTISDVAETRILSSTASNGAMTFYYSDALDATKALVDPQTITVSYDTYTNANALKGKYYAAGSATSIKMYIPGDAPDATREINGSSYDVVMNAASVSAVSETITYRYVNSPDANAYPPAVDDGYTYEYLGQLGQSMTKIATGSYTGTGKYGSSNPNSLTFDFVPKALFIIQSGGNGGFCAWFEGSDFLSGVADGVSGPVSSTLTQNDNTLSWYNTVNANRQWNGNYSYCYLAIG